MASASQCNPWPNETLDRSPAVAAVRHDVDLDYVDVRWRLTGWAAEFIDADTLAIDDTGFPKDGTDSPGVARMYCGALGKIGRSTLYRFEITSRSSIRLSIG